MELDVFFSLRSLFLIEPRVYLLVWRRQHNQLFDTHWVAEKEFIYVLMYAVPSIDFIMIFLCSIVYAFLLTLLYVQRLISDCR